MNGFLPIVCALTNASHWLWEVGVWVASVFDKEHSLCGWQVDDINHEY